MIERILNFIQDNGDEKYVTLLTILLFVIAFIPILARSVESLATFSNKRRKNQREKERLEILKLKYEIESIKKEHKLQLEDEIEKEESNLVTWYSFPGVLHNYVLDKLVKFFSKKKWYTSGILTIVTSFLITVLWGLLVIIMPLLFGMDVDTFKRIYPIFFGIVIPIGLIMFYFGFSLFGKVYRKVLGKKSYNTMVVATLIGILLIELSDLLF